MSSLPSNIKRIGSKATEKSWRHHFPHFKSMGAFCCHGHQSFDPICLKTLCSLSPPQVMLHIRFDQDWPTGFRDIQIRKCKIFVIQGQVTPKWVVWSSPKSNSSKLLCLSWLPATLMMIRSTSSQKGNDRSPESRWAKVNLPQNLMQPFPHPNDATHTIGSRLANWLQRY